MRGKLELKGMVFGRLKVIAEDTVRTKDKKVKWICKCECGKIASVVGYRLRKGLTQSCGCLNREISSELHTTHGLKGHPLYAVHNGMRARCYNINNNAYKNYGARGITVCDRWLESFENFYEDMKAGWKKGLQIDRIDNDGNYEPSNCRWVTRDQNQMNTRPKEGGSSKYKGVSKTNSRWVARIKGEHIGVFDCEKEAALMYNRRARELFGKYAYINKIED